jgi:hypothetical protein
VFVARFGAIRWYDDSDRLIERPAMWMPLPDAVGEPEPTRRARAAKT